MNTQTHEELEEQTVKAFAAFRKNPDIPIQMFGSISNQWYDLRTPKYEGKWDGSFDQFAHYRIKPEPPKPVEVEIWWHPDKLIPCKVDDSDPTEQPHMLAAGFVRATATIKVKEGE